MKAIWSWAQACIAVLGGFFGWFFGGFDGFLYALVIFVVLDYLTGVLCAVLDHKLSSEIGARGIFKKVLIFVLVGVGNILDELILSGASPGGNGVIRTAVVFFYLSNEGVSILENAAHIGLPVPQKLKDVLGQLHDRNDEEDQK